jgi:hypothetical protein
MLASSRAASDGSDVDGVAAGLAASRVATGGGSRALSSAASGPSPCGPVGSAERIGSTLAVPVARDRDSDFMVVSFPPAPIRGDALASLSSHTFRRRQVAIFLMRNPHHRTVTFRGTLASLRRRLRARHLGG